MFAGLNQLDPPAMGDDNLDLGGVGGNYNDNGLLSDYPSAALDAQLETWSNLTFDFTDQSPFDYAAANNYEEKVGGEGDDQDLDNRAGVVAGRNNDQVYGLLNSAEQARQFQELLLESSSSISSLHPSLAYPGRQLPLPPLSSLSSSIGNYSNGLPDFNELPSLQSAIASTSTLPVATTSRLPLLPPSTHSTPTTRSSPASSSTSTNKKVAKKAKVEKAVAAPVKVESEEDNELSIEGDEETSLEDKRKRNTAASGSFFPFFLLSFL
jgi:hypothetical protein